VTDFINPLPELTSVSRTFYSAARQRKLLIQYCTKCQKTIFYPKFFCPHCLGSELDWIESRGHGKLYSYTIVHSAAPEAFKLAVPYVIGVIDLDEGARMLSWIVECDHSDIQCDMAVQVTFKDLDDEVALPMFKPAVACS